MANCSACIHSTVCVSAFDPEVLDEDMRCIDFLEESKVLIKPCEIGDTVWCVGSKCLSGEYDELCDEMLDCNDCRLLQEYIVFRREVTPYFLAGLTFADEVFNPQNNFIWGQTVFATEERARRELERMNCYE